MSPVLAEVDWWRELGDECDLEDPCTIDVGVELDRWWELEGEREVESSCVVGVVVGAGAAPTRVKEK